METLQNKIDFTDDTIMKTLQEKIDFAVVFAADNSGSCCNFYRLEDFLQTNI